MRPSVNIFWFRRDLRLADNAGLFHALIGSLPVLPVFIFDKEILEDLEDKKDRRVEFIHNTLTDLNEQLISYGSCLQTRYGTPSEVFGDLLNEFQVENVFTNHDYEPYAIQRDNAIKVLLRDKNVGFLTFKDQVIFEKNEVIKDNGQPYTVFTPYSKKWKELYLKQKPFSFENENFYNNFFQQQPRLVLSLDAIGFKRTGETFPSKEWKPETIKQYASERNFPAKNGTTRLSVHLRFGTVSIRQLAIEAGSLDETFLNELIWREFYKMILWHFPKVVGNAFKTEYEAIPWRNNEMEFDLWCKGMTGYPIVDAGMQELDQTGFMHNRVRMITASFLTKHLLIDWRWGEAWFAKKLLDFDLASNNGGWQWAAGSGCDAAPYFRVFNPSLQADKFDSQQEYIRQWVPEIGASSYPPPIVEHADARKRCLMIYSNALKK